MKSLILTAVLTYILLFPQYCISANTYSEISIVRVNDGDNIVMDIEVWSKLTKRVSVRIDGIDTPESDWRAKCEEEKEAGIRAWSYLLSLTYNAKVITLTDIDEGKFVGRILGLVLIDGQNVAGLLIDAGHAVAYNGQSKPDWCLDNSFE